MLTVPELSALGEAGKVVEAKGYVWSGGEQPARLTAEFSRTAKHLRGTLSMARGRDVDSAGSQFFICVAAAPQLDGEYTIFGQASPAWTWPTASPPARPCRASASTRSTPVPITRIEVLRGRRRP